MPSVTHPGPGTGTGAGPLGAPSGGTRLEGSSGATPGLSGPPHGGTQTGTALSRGAPPQQLAEASELLSKAGKALASVRFSLDVLVENIGSTLREASATAATSSAPGGTTNSAGASVKLESGAAGQGASGPAGSYPWRGAAEKARDGAASAVRQFYGAVKTLSATAKVLEELGVLSSQDPSHPSSTAGPTAATTGPKGATTTGAVAGQGALQVKGEEGQVAGSAAPHGAQGPVTLFPGRVPLVCPDSVMQSYAWKRQIAGHAATSAALRARLALESFRSHRKRIFPEMHITPPELAPVPPKRPRLAEAGPEGMPGESQPNPTTVSADTPASALGAEGQEQGPGHGQVQGQPPVEGTTAEGVGGGGVETGKEEPKALGGAAPVTQTTEATGTATTGGVAGAGGTGPAEGAQTSGSEAQPTGPSLPPQSSAVATPAPPVPLPAPALASKTLGKPLLQGKGVLGRPGLRGSNILGSRLPPMKSGSAMDADDLGPLEEETVPALPAGGADDAAGGKATPSGALGESGSAGGGAGPKLMAMDADDLGPIEGDEVLPEAAGPTKPGDAPGETSPVDKEAEGTEKEKEKSGEGTEGDGVKGSVGGPQAMDVDSEGAAAQEKSEGLPGLKVEPGAKAVEAAGGSGAPSSTGDTAPAAPGTAATAAGEGGGASAEAADLGKAGGVPGPGGAPGAAAAGDPGAADGPGTPAVEAQEAPPAPSPEPITVLPVEEHRNGRALKQVLREVLKERGSTGVQVAVCSRREWVQAVASAWAQSMSAPQAGSGHTLGAPGLGLATAIGGLGSGQSWQKRTLWTHPLSLAAEGEESTAGADAGGGPAGGTGAKARAGAGAGAGVRAGAVAGTGRPAAGPGKGTSVALQAKLGEGKKAGARQWNPKGGAQQGPGVGVVEPISEVAKEGSGEKDGEKGEGGEGEDHGHLLGVVEVLLPGVVRAVLSLAPAGSCAVTRLGLFAHNEIGPHVSPWGESRHEFLRRVAQQMQPVVLCPSSEGGGEDAAHLRKVVDEVTKLADLFVVERGYLALR